jgi:hypothetical protein
MKKLIAILLVLAFSLPAAALVEDGEVEYLGGTAIGLKENTTGHFDTTQVRSLVFEYKGGKLEIPYSRMTHYEYTRKLARHLGVAPTIAVVMIKHLQRRHFFQIDYKDEEGIAQSVIFEVAKDIPQTLEAVLRVRATKATHVSWQGNDPCKTDGLITENCPQETMPACAGNATHPCTSSPQPPSQPSIRSSAPAGQQPAQPVSPAAANAAAPAPAPAPTPAPAPSAWNAPPAPAPQPVVAAPDPAASAQPAAQRSAGKREGYPGLVIRKRPAEDDDDAVELSKGSNN